MSNNKNYLLPVHVIKAAADGDVEAINYILKHYDGYIAKLATRKFYDEYGQSYYGVDPDLKRRLETKLITKILDFEVA